jgi:hypothetical protein
VAGAVAPVAKRSLNENEGRNDRVTGAGASEENRVSNEASTDAVVAGVSEGGSAAQRVSNVARLRLATRAGGALATSAGRTEAFVASRPSKIPAHRLSANVSPADPAATDATPTRTRTRPPIFNATHPKRAASQITMHRIREIRQIWLPPEWYYEG